MRILALIAAMAVVGCMGSDERGPRGRVVLYDGRSPFAALIPVGGGQVERLRLRPEAWDAIAFSRDGKRIAYDADDGIYVADADGGNARRLPGQPSTHDFLNTQPSWSPDGDRIAFEHDRSLYTISSEGGDLDFLAHGSAPKWALDGRVVFASGYDRNSVYANIVVMRLDGGDRRILARGDYFDISPDGESLAYSGPGGTDPDANRRAVYVVRLDGGERRRVTNDGYAPIWSPDGDYLAITRVTGCGHAVCRGRVFVIPSEGGRARAIGPVTGDPGGAVAWIG